MLFPESTAHRFSECEPHHRRVESSCARLTGCEHTFFPNRECVKTPELICAQRASGIVPPRIRDGVERLADLVLQGSRNDIIQWQCESRLWSIYVCVIEAAQEKPAQH